MRQQMLPTGTYESEPLSFFAEMPRRNVTAKKEKGSLSYVPTSSILVI